jgi:TonB family protein
MPLGWAIVLSLLTAFQNAPAQAPPRHTVVRWTTLDIVVLDDVSGIRLIFAPKPRTEIGAGTDLPSVSADPAAALDWARQNQPRVDSATKGIISRGHPFVTSSLSGRGQAWIDYDPERRGDASLVLMLVGAGARDTFAIAASWGELMALVDSVGAMAARSTAGATAWADSVPPDQGDESPRMTHRPSIHYPEQALRERREGRVWLLFTIDSTGAAERGSMEVLLSDGDDFTREATDALGRARYRPARHAGVPVRISAIQRFTFRGGKAVAADSVISHGLGWPWPGYPRGTRPQH